jgi:hypothetical protein
MTWNVSQRAHRRLAFTALTVASAGALVAQMAAPASASAPVTTSILNDVSCTSPGNCMAVGYFQESGPGTVYFTLAEKWNGSTWTIVPSPSPQHPGGGALLTAVSCASSIRCMAVGNTLFLNAHGSFVLRPLAESWNGTSWTVLPTAKLAQPSAVLDGVSCVGAGRCMAAGHEGPVPASDKFTLAEAWNGTAWRVVPTPPPPVPGGTALGTVSCTSSASCIAVGYAGFNNGSGASVTLAESWNGIAWLRQATPTPGGSGALAGVSCTASPACTAVGGRAVNSPTLFMGTLAERWNGTRWVAQPTPNPGGASTAGFGAVSCTRPAACMAVGSSEDQVGEFETSVAEAWNGTRWTLLHTPVRGSFADELRGIACTSPANCTAVGTFAGDNNAPLRTLAEAWNGTLWRVVKSPNP